MSVDDITANAVAIMKYMRYIATREKQIDINWTDEPLEQNIILYDITLESY